MAHETPRNPTKPHETPRNPLVVKIIEDKAKEQALIELNEQKAGLLYSKLLSLFLDRFGKKLEPLTEDEDPFDSEKSMQDWRKSLQNESALRELNNSSIEFDLGDETTRIIMKISMIYQSGFNSQNKEFRIAIFSAEGNSVDVAYLFRILEKGIIAESPSRISHAPSDRNQIQFGRKYGSHPQWQRLATQEEIEAIEDLIS